MKLVICKHAETCDSSCGCYHGVSHEPVAVGHDDTCKDGFRCKHEDCFANCCEVQDDEDD